MNRAFALTQSAARDLDAILAYLVETAGPASAARVANALRLGMSRAARHPYLGHTGADLGDDTLRVHVVNSYLIVYLP